ncbi:MAG TPA: hypothetical protein VKV40_22015 [Ktedonobacteraceae bacterium]|nr:hypothetical protein [Ktedonobacteraceae bacterium]
MSTYETGNRKLPGAVIDRGQRQFSTPDAGKPARWPLWVTLFAGIMLELLFLLIFALVPLPGLHLYSTPLLDVWVWTLAPSRWLFPEAWLAPASSSTPFLLLFAATLLALVGTYALTVIVIRRVKRVGADRDWLLLVLVGTLVFGITLLFLPKLFSDDVFSYIFSGRILSIYHLDPLNTAPFQFPSDPYLRWVISGRGAPNIYGPFWLCISSLLVGIGASQNADPAVTLLLFKGFMLLSHLCNCLLLWLILGKLAPERRLVGTLLYAWNPLVLLELAGMGHYEGILLTLFLLAVFVYVWGRKYSGRWYEIAVLAIFGLATGTNLVALLITPLFVWFTLRTENNMARAVWAFCWRMGIVLACMILIYLPFWRGAPTFFAITSAIDMAHFVHSPLGVLVGPMRGFFSDVARWAHFPPIMQPVTAADLTLRGSATVIFAIIYLYLFGQVRLAPVASVAQDGVVADKKTLIPGFDVVLSSWCGAVLAYLFLASGEFWPWYVLWVLWIVVMRRLDILTITVLLLSSTSLFVYPLMDVTRHPVVTYLTVLIFGLPLVFLLTGSSGKHYRRRRRITERNVYDGRSEATQD